MTEASTLVTVLMPCWRPHQGFLKAALDSVFAQTSGSWKLLVIVDNDEDAALAGALLPEDPRAAVIRNESALVTWKLNTGMRHAGTPFVCSLLGDDLLAPHAISVLNTHIGSYPGVDYFHSSHAYIDAAGRRTGRVYNARVSFTLADFKNQGQVKHLNCWRVRAALEIGGMDESLGLHGADDYDFPWCMAEAGCVFRAIPDYLYLYRDHQEHFRLTTHVPLKTQIRELRKIWAKHGLTEAEMEAQIERRSKGYLRQALFLDEQDRLERG